MHFFIFHDVGIAFLNLLLHRVMNNHLAFLLRISFKNVAL